jgi:hypothetical protein
VRYALSPYIKQIGFVFKVLNKTRNVCINLTFRRVRVTIVAVEKQVSITYSECVSVALVIQHAKRMRRVILSSVACPAVPYLPTLSHKRYDFRGNKLLNIKCFGFPENFCPKHFSL